MIRSLVYTGWLVFVVTGVAAAATVNGSISGTCGFYQGTRSNVVYSQAFSGDGTFCTGFLPGGSFTDSGILQVGDVFSLAHNTISASAPAGYGVFVSFDTTFQVNQQYLVTTPAPATTPTGTLRGFLAGTGTTDDGSGLGTCAENVTLTLGGVTAPAPSGFSIPISFNSPIVSSSATARIHCDDYGPIGGGFGDDGVQQLNAAALLVYDAKGALVGPATLVTTPEPGTGVIGVLAMAWVVLRRKRQSGNCAG